MLKIIDWIKKILEKIREIKLPKFINDFLVAMDNSKNGHSLKKWLAVGFFWIIAKVTIENTNEHNLLEVIIALSTTLLTLAGIYTMYDFKNKKLDAQVNKDNKPTEDANTGNPEEPEVHNI